MTFTPGTPSNTSATLPTRRFGFVLDPNCLTGLATAAAIGILQLVQDLRLLDPPVIVGLALPRYLSDDRTLGYAEKGRTVLSVVDRPDSISGITLSQRIPQRHRKHLTNATAGTRAVELLALCDFLQADGIITDDQFLVDARYPLLQHHRIRVVPLAECGDWIEVCAHGHGVFWSGSDANRHLTIDIFYQSTNWKNRRFANWFLRWTAQFTSLNVLEDMRNVILNRYPFLLYSRDMVRFFELQLDHYRRRGLQRRFSTPLGYYISNFYVHLWGTLDHLTVIAMKVLGLEIEQRECGIDSRRFWKALATKKPGLRAFMRRPKMVQWVRMMADMRHAAAHRQMLLPTELVEASGAYGKSDAEVSEILSQEEPDFYEGLPDEARAMLEPNRIWLWRMNQVETIATNVVVVQTEKQHYIRSPVDSVDFDLSMVTAVMDAFFVGLFARADS